MKKVRKVLTTGQVAKILQFSQQTVIRLCNRGELTSFKVPGGSRHRRIPVEALVDHARVNNIPFDQSLLPDFKKGSNPEEVVVEDIKEKPINVLVIDKEGGTTSRVATILSKRNCEVRRIEELFPAGAMAGRFLQDIILVGSAFTGNLLSILKTFPGEPLKIIQEREDGWNQIGPIDNYLDVAFNRRQQKESREHDHPQLILCL